MALRWGHRAWDIDFAGPSFGRSLHRIRAVPFIAGLVGLLAVGWAVDGALDVLQQDNVVNEEVAAIRHQLAVRARLQPVASGPALSGPETDNINAKVAQLNLPWNELFAALEAATPTNVALLELAPDARKHIVTGIAEAAGSDDMLKYMSRLGGQPFFSSVMLSRHETNLTDPNKPLRFHFTAQWGGAIK